MSKKLSRSLYPQWILLFIEFIFNRVSYESYIKLDVKQPRAKINPIKFSSKSIDPESMRESAGLAGHTRRRSKIETRRNRSLTFGNVWARRASSFSFSGLQRAVSRDRRPAPRCVPDFFSPRDDRRRARYHIPVFRDAAHFRCKHVARTFRASFRRTSSSSHRSPRLLNRRSSSVPWQNSLLVKPRANKKAQIKECAGGSSLRNDVRALTSFLYNRTNRQKFLFCLALNCAHAYNTIISLILTSTDKSS